MEPTTHPTPSSLPRRSWWSRNWKWFVPTGCLSLFVLFLAFVAVLVFVVFAAMKSSDVYKAAVARAKASPAVTEELGSPLQEGMFVSGSTNTSGGSGSADLSIPVSGPKGKGTIYVAATKSGGEWIYSKLFVEVAQTKAKIDLAETDGAAGDKD